MSTLKVTNIQDTAGGNSSTSAEIYEGRVRAWVNFDGTGTVSINDSYNVSSITDHATGEYTVTFTNALPSQYYVAFGSNIGQSSNAYTYSWLAGADSTANALHSTTAVRVITVHATASKQDYNMVSVAVVGG